ncbi:MAG TPA: type ISP restriction/modification enzyme, partial [Dongiaceae bacterium]|nr:type ISP restriction/modification enzyme [Dongiaceae bacterium]
RLAERRIAEKTGKGIVCYISNFSYLGDPSFVIMRERFLAEFDTLFFDCLNGDSRETGKRTPEGKPDPSVFSTEYNREGIRVGTAIGLSVRRPKRSQKPQVFFRQFWGANKRGEILESLGAQNLLDHYEKVEPSRENHFSFLPTAVSREYLKWPKVLAVAAVHPFNGPIERRGNSLIVFEEARQELGKLAAYLDPKVTDEEIKAAAPAFMKSSGEFDAKKARAALKGFASFRPEKIVRYPFKPFDLRLAYLDADIQPLFSRPSPELLQQRFKGNSFFITRDTADKDLEGAPFYFSPLVCDYDCLSGHARHFPIRLRAGLKASRKDDGNGEFDSILHESAPGCDAGGTEATANLSTAARAYLAALGIRNPDADAEAASLLWMHALAIGFSPLYLTQNADGIREDWPRIPLPNSRAALLASAALGRQVAALLNTEESVGGVTTGKPRSELRTIAVLSSTESLCLTAGWGHAGQGGVTMPGKGKLLTRPYRPEEQPQKPLLDPLGHSTHDIFLNDTTCWRNVPEKVWDFTIGGYQVMKKWLSYREHGLLGRPLTPDEAREVTHAARRLAALLLLAPALDANYAAAKACATPLPGLSARDWRGGGARLRRRG